MMEQLISENIYKQMKDKEVTVSMDLQMKSHA